MKPHQKFYRLSLVLSLIMTSLLVISACSPQPAASTEAPTGSQPVEETEQQPAATEEKVLIRVMTNDAYARSWQDNYVPEFQKTYPNIDVEIVGVPYADLLPKEMLELTSSPSNFDIFVTDDPWTPQLAQTGLVMDLKKDVAEYTAEDFDWEDIHSAPLAAGEWEGVQYGVPLRSNLLLMFYNKELFKAAGVPLPDENMTWDSFVEILPSLVRDSDGDGQVDTWAFSTYFIRDQLTPTIWQTMLNSNGGQVLDEDFKPAFNTPAGVDALKLHMELLKYAPPGGEAYGYNETIEAFRQSKVAIMFNWGSVYSGVAVNPETTKLTPEIVGVTTMPAGSVGPSSHRGIWIGVIPKNTAHPKEAWTFLQWMSSKEGEKFTGSLGVFPARKSTLTASELPLEWQGPLFKAILAGFNAIENGKMWRPRLPDSDAVQRILALHHSRALTGEVTAEQALIDAESEIINTLTEKGYYE